MKQSDKNEKNRRCGRCGCSYNQSIMIRVSKRMSDTGWLCEDCYEDIEYQDEENYRESKRL